MRLISSGTFWICIYLAVVAAPLVLLLLGDAPGGAGFPWDLSMALGFAGITMMGVQFALTARFRRATAPFGIDIIYYFHRYMAVIAFLMIVAHVVIVLIRYPDSIGSFNPRTASWYMTAGFTGFIIFAALIVTSLWRKLMHIEYDRWRLWHAVLAIAAFALAVAHIEGVGHYLNAPFKHALWIGFMVLWVLLIVYVRLIKPWRMKRRPYRIADVRKERGRAWTVVLAPTGHGGMNYHPGQFAWVTLRASPFHLKEHPFSFSSSSTSPGRLEFTIKELGDFTRTVKDLQAGETAYLDGPYGLFCADRYPAASAFVFIAGGVGIAPIISMLRALADQGERKPVTLFYGNRLWDHVIFREELEDLSNRLNLNIVHVLAEPPDGWSGEIGYITKEVLERHLGERAEGVEYFICGPQPMIDLVEQSLHTIRIPLRHVHSEIFDLA